MLFLNNDNHFLYDQLLECVVLTPTDIYLQFIDSKAVVDNEDEKNLCTYFTRLFLVSKQLRQ